jgi:hypothetical protein
MRLFSTMSTGPIGPGGYEAEVVHSDLIAPRRRDSVFAEGGRQQPVARHYETAGEARERREREAEARRAVRQVFESGQPSVWCHRMIGERIGAVGYSADEETLVFAGSLDECRRVLRKLREGHATYRQMVVDAEKVVVTREVFEALAASEPVLYGFRIRRGDQFYIRLED